MTEMSGDLFGGHVDPAFAPVAEVFRANFEDSSPYKETGAALTVYAGGRKVVDIWGGLADPEKGVAWAENTLVNAYSTGKGLVAVAIAQLAGEGRLSYADTVASHWPEFAANGKGAITIAQALSHQAGLNAFKDDITLAELYDWDLVIARIAAQETLWEPGSRTVYHSITYGFILGEVIRRVSGLAPRDYVAQRIAGPLGADVFVGAPRAEWGRIAVLSPPPPPPANRPAPDPLVLRTITNPAFSPFDTASEGWRNAQIPAVNAHVTARGMARIYAAIGNGGILDGVRLMTEEAATAIQQPLSAGPDLMMGPGSWGGGVLINRNGLFGPGARAFGSCGFGGSQAYADPETGIASGYTPNRLYGSATQDPRAMALAVVTAECAGR